SSPSSAGNGQASPAALARPAYSRTVLRASPVLRAIARSLSPSAFSRNISLTLRIDALSAGIRSPSWQAGEPMRFNQRSSPRHPRGGRLQIGIGGRLGSEQAAGFKSESEADFIPESVAGFLRNSQSASIVSQKEETHVRCEIASVDKSTTFSLCGKRSRGIK